MQVQFFTRFLSHSQKCKLKQHMILVQHSMVFLNCIIIVLPSFNRYPLYRNLLPVCCASSFFFLALKCFLSSLTQVKFPKTGRNPLHAQNQWLNVEAQLPVCQYALPYWKTSKIRKKNRNTRLIISIVHLEEIEKSCQLPNLSLIYGGQFGFHSNFQFFTPPTMLHHSFLKSIPFIYFND